MAIKGTCKYPGYRTGGIVPFKGPKNKRKRHQRLEREKVAAEKMERVLIREQQMGEVAAEWGGYSD